ncbi:uncharacterized protein N7483_002767 [Penicillium malachiteum]|uniref:uncharacterized protein n=1 Tax=Penicillium malachiteum TaxID=1324776 RepID=UPI002547B8A4|nr:uncharacterized protein N7483_002767 [Penicillium malachiteum]KAJ5737642.1 hypothetical protein N7483_002767 [Penicillium malachiteum]
MASPSTIELNEIFQHSTATHAYTLHWTSIGAPASTPLVFIHGTPWSSHIWYAHAQALSSHFHVYLFDNPTFGASPLGQPLPGKSHAISKEAELDADFSQESEVFAALYNHWKASWGSKDAHVVAHGSGALMSLRAFILHDCQFLSLYLINVTTLGPSPHPYFERFKNAESFFQSLTLEDFDKIVAAFIRGSTSSKLGEELIETLKTPWVSTEEGNKAFIRQMIRASQHNADEVEDRYPEVGLRIPVRIAWGDEDHLNHVVTASKLKEKLNAKEVFVIEGAGHLVMLDNVIELGVDLRRWLDQQQQRTHELKVRIEYVLQGP